MNKLIKLIFIVFIATSCCNEKQNVKVACVGDSITEGFGINWQADNSYPAQLDSMLGEGYTVINFGRSATTMSRSGDFPYWSAKEFRNMLNFKPDITIIKLGTNDCKRYNWNREAFEKSYQLMVDTLRAVQPANRIIVCLPVPVMQEKWEMTDSVITNGVIPAIKQIAERNNLETIDLYSALEGKPELFVDGIHPSKAGAGIIAKAVAEAIKSR